MLKISESVGSSRAQLRCVFWCERARDCDRLVFSQFVYQFRVGLSRLVPTARDCNRVASFGVIVLTIRLDSTGQKLKCSESERLVKTGRV